jgi:hypothetical protein
MRIAELTDRVLDFFSHTLGDIPMPDQYGSLGQAQSPSQFDAASILTTPAPPPEPSLRDLAREAIQRARVIRVNTSGSLTAIAGPFPEPACDMPDPCGLRDELQGLVTLLSELVEDSGILATKLGGPA